MSMANIAMLAAATMELDGLRDQLSPVNTGVEADGTRTWSITWATPLLRIVFEDTIFALLT